VNLKTAAHELIRKTMVTPEKLLKLSEIPFECSEAVYAASNPIPGYRYSMSNYRIYSTCYFPVFSAISGNFLLLILVKMEFMLRGDLCREHIGFYFSVFS
jgi:hypothetical protein